MKTTFLAAAALAASMGFAAAHAQTYYYDQYGRVVSERQLTQEQRRALRAEQRAGQRAQTRAWERQQRQQQLAQAEQARRIREAQLQAQVLGSQGYHGVPPWGLQPCPENTHQPQFSSGSMLPCY